MQPTNYRLIVFKEIYEDGSFEFVAKYPAIDAVMGVGDSYEEAIQEAEEAKEAYLSYLEEEGRPFPKQLDMDALSGRVTFRMSKSLHKKALERSELEQVSLNQLINEALTEYVSKENTKDDLCKRLSKTFEESFFKFTVPASREKVQSGAITYSSPLNKSLFQSYSSNNSHRYGGVQ